MRNQVVFYLNGKRHEVGASHGGMMLADYLRYERALTGTKIVCAEGDCGACSVLRYFPFGQGMDTDNFLPINSCISPVASMDGSGLITIEALRDKNGLHEAQRAMVECHGSQCGFCTPGFVMALTGLVEEKLSKKESSINSVEAKNCMTGNLCRCTGYQPIIDAALAMDLNRAKSVKARYFTDHQHAELKKAFQESVLLESAEFTYFAPKTMKEALSYLKDNPDTRIVGAATDLGVIHNKRKIKLSKLLSLHLIEELYRIEQIDQVVTLGARVTLAEFRHFIKDKLPDFARYLDVFASPQIKNVGTVVGNVANASPIGDTPAAFLALNATLTIASDKGQEELPLDKFFLAYRKTNLKAAEIITGIKFRLPEKSSAFRLFKNANRKDLDISAVNMAIKVDWSGDSIQDIRIAAGGVAAIPLRLKMTEDHLKKNPQDLNGALKVMHAEFTPISDVRASAAYRHVLMENFMRRFFAEARGV